jgi:hypothetical protein
MGLVYRRKCRWNPTNQVRKVLAQRPVQRGVSVGSKEELSRVASSVLFIFITVSGESSDR